MYFLSVVQLILGLLLLSLGVEAQVAPFNINGRINSMTQSTTGTLKGGSINVDGIAVTVPDNLLVTLPSITVAWSELFNAGTPNLPGALSGWEAEVYGNRVNGAYVAGLIYISQQGTRSLQGFIDSIDTATGHFKVGGRDCVLNDPVGRFALPYTQNPLWSVDPDNPSVKSTTGFPLCIPRSATDDKCPKKNRPNDAGGKPVQKLTFKDPATLTATDPDPRIMMPLAVGDYVTISGVDIGGLLAVYSLEANLGIYTAPGTKPAYLTAEEALYAVVQGAPNGEDGETRAVIFSTDPSASIQMFAMDQDPCTGEFTKRNLMLAKANADVPIGRARFRGGKTDFSPATRAVGFEITTGTSQGPSGIVAGSFVQPIMEYIFPELTTFGDPMIPLGFERLPYLAKGSGPFVPGNLLSSPPATPVIVGQLNPWPGATTPVATSCPPVQPNPTTLSTATAVPTPGPTPDTVTINTATSTSGKGQFTVAVTATTNNLDAILSCAVAGVDPIAATPMTKVAGTPGRWSFTITVKGRPSSVTVTSNKGGRATRAV